MNTSLRVALTVASAALALSACGKKEESQVAQQPAAAAEEEKVLHVFNWSDYIADDTIKNFEDKTGIKVTYDVFDSNDVLESRFAGRTANTRGGDMGVPTGRPGADPSRGNSSAADVANATSRRRASACGLRPSQISLSAMSRASRACVATGPSRQTKSELNWQWPQWPMAHFMLRSIDR